jgi:hypothetical protein
MVLAKSPPTGPYPEPDESTPHTPISLRSTLILSSRLRLGLPSDLFLSGSPAETLIIPPVCYKLYPLSLILSLRNFLQPAVTSPLLGPISNSAPCSQTPSVYVLPLVL